MNYQTSAETAVKMRRSRNKKLGHGASPSAPMPRFLLVLSYMIRTIRDWGKQNKEVRIPPIAFTDGQREL